MSDTKKKVNEIITEQFIEAIETKGFMPWEKPWKVFTFNGSNPCAAWNLTGYGYHGTNELLLSMLPYEIPCYVTFNQAKKLGGNIKKGEKGHIVCFWKVGAPQKVRDEETGEISIKKPFMLRYTRVFNIEQTEGLEAKLPKIEEKEALPEFEQIAKCEELVSQWNDCPQIEHVGSRACYIPSKDLVRMPKPESFHTSAGYYQTLFHELTHSTGHETRLARKMKDSFGSDGYSKEELTAELGASFLSARCGIFEQVQRNSEAYVKNWIKQLKNDPNMIIHASSRAQKAFNHITGEGREAEATKAA